MRISFMDELICQQEGWERLSRRKLEERQLELINMQLLRARSRSSFYRDYPEKLLSLHQLQELPFMGAEELRQCFPQLCLSPNEELIRLRTSGTTGKPKRVAYTQYDCDRTRDFFTAGLTELIEPGDRVFAAFPNTDSNSLGGLLADAIHAIGAHICCMTGQETYYELANLVRSRDCNVYVGAPVLLLSLLRLLGEASPLKRALVSGDVCHDVVVKACEERLGSRLFPHYGLRESGLGGAMSCQAHCGMHIRENDMLFEIIDDEGQPLPDGSWGELVLTSFGMEAMPLFRYRTGDRGRILAGPCPCGSLVKRLEVSGRLRSTSQLTRLDGRLFACKALVDAKIAEDGLVLLALPGQELALRQLEGISESTAVYVRSITAEDRPFFSGKRK